MLRSWAFWLPAVVLSTVLLGHFGLLPFLWGFPLGGGLGLWVILAAADGAAQASGLERLRRARPLLWCGGVLWFTARDGVPFLGLALLLLPFLLWLGVSRRMPRFFSVVTICLVALGALGHLPDLLHPGLTGRLAELRFSAHLLATFFVFRGISYALNAGVREGKADFLRTLEYFLAPAFWLSPLHSSYLVWTHTEERRPAGLLPFWWMGRGLLHAVLFGLVYAVFSPWLARLFGSGLSHWQWWEALALGPALFLLTYLEKSRVSYLAAGFLSFTGFPVEPDFRAPWRARSLTEYWRRFHFWVWEFYVDTIFAPLSVWLSRRAGVAVALYGGIFLTFLAGTTLSHYIFYPAPFSVALSVGLLFGSATLLHALLDPWLKGWWGIPFTWLTVFLLYIVAYPAYGLGWGLAEFWAFVRS